MEKRIDKCLALCRDWAEGRVASGNEPPWAWYQYMKLIETVAAIQTGRAAVSAGVLAGEPQRVQAPAPGANREAVTDIGARRRQRRDDDDDDDDDDPSLPM
jgi:hypothetical protein